MELSSEHYQLRVAKDSEALVQEGHELLIGDRNELLKAYGLRPVDNIFWRINNSDVHAALSFDRLHAHHAGLFGKHLWEELQERITDLGRQAVKQLDDQMFQLPRWRELNHFDQVMGISYTDARKYEDISKVQYFFVSMPIQIIVFCT